MGNEDESESVFCLEILEHVENLGLDRHVKRRNRLVADNHLWFHHQRSCNRNSLALAAGILVRPFVLSTFRVDTNRIKNAGNQCPLCVTCFWSPHVERLRNDFADRPPRVERRNGVLKDHLDVGATGRHFSPAQLCQLFAVKLNRPARWMRKLEKRFRRRGFSTARFTNQAKRLTATDVKTDTTHRVNDIATFRWKLNCEVLHPNHHVIAIAEMCCARTCHYVNIPWSASRRAAAPLD